MTPRGFSVSGADDRSIRGDKAISKGMFPTAVGNGNDRDILIAIDYAVLSLIEMNLITST